MYLSGNALNLNWIITHFLHVFNPDRYGALIDGQAELIKTASPSLTSVSSLLFGLVFLVTLIKFFRSEKTFENLVRFSLLGYWAYFMFNPGVHENHLFIVLLLAVILYWLNKEHMILMICIILMANFNLYLFYGSNGLGPGFSRVIGGIDLALVGAIFNLLFFCLVWWMNVRPEKRHVTHQPVA